MQMYGFQYRAIYYFRSNLGNTSASKANALKSTKNYILKDPGLREIYINPKTNDTWQEGDIYKRLNFADTLERIATRGFQEFYEGKTAKNFVKDLKNLGGIITMKDLKNYQ